MSIIHCGHFDISVNTKKFCNVFPVSGLFTNIWNLCLLNKKIKKNGKNTKIDKVLCSNLIA